jgi:HEPN domain-containing protein
MDKELKVVVKKWLLKAGNDLKTAMHGFKAKKIITDSICFHCQQAVEKYLKAYLISRNIAPVKTHKIEVLLAECIKFDLTFNELQDSSILTEYAVELRYPDDFYIPDIEEAKDAYKLAKKVKLFVIKRIK